MRERASSGISLMRSASSAAASGNASGRPYCFITDIVSNDGFEAGPMISVISPSGATWRFSQRTKRITTRSPSFAPFVSAT